MGVLRFGVGLCGLWFGEPVKAPPWDLCEPEEHKTNPGDAWGTMGMCLAPIQNPHPQTQKVRAD